MSWLDRLRKKAPSKNKYADMLNGYTPLYSQFGQDIYVSDVVQQAIMCIVSEMKKLIPSHIRQMDIDVAPVKGNIQNVLNFPNETMTTSDLIEKMTWNLFFNYNSWLIPTYDIWYDSNNVAQKHYTGIYPVQPTLVEMQEDANGKLYVQLSFANGFKTTLPYSDVIHIKYKFSVDDFLGGNNFGQPDNTALLKTLQLNYDLLQGVSSAMKSSFAINGVVKYNTMMDDGKTEAALKELEAKLKSSESGFLPLDLKAEYIPIKHEIQLVDAETLKFIDEKILRHFGVPLCILTGDYTKEQYEAFYQKTLEPLIKSFSEAFTRTLFTQREKSFGNKIQFYPKDLVFMSVDQTLEMVRLLGDSGSIYENEKRVAFGLRPLPELVGVRMQSLNYVNVDIAQTYQVGQNNSNDKNNDDNENDDQNESGDVSDTSDGGETDEQ